VLMKDRPQGVNLFARSHYGACYQGPRLSDDRTRQSIPID
jgi:hypothetical protein